MTKYFLYIILYLLKFKARMQFSTRAARHHDVRGEDGLRDEVLGLRHLDRHVADHAPAGGD